MSENEELFELDLDSTVRQSRQAVSSSEEVCEYARRTARVCEKALARARLLILHSLLTYEEMNLVFRMEEYFGRHRYLGVHWLKQLKRLNKHHEKRLVEANMFSGLLD